MRQVVVTWSGNIPGFGDARPDGRFAVSVPGSHVVTDAVTIAQPVGHPALYITLPPTGPRIACAWSDGGPDRVKEWTGSAWVDHGLCCGTNPVIYGLDGVLHISHCEMPQGSIGWRYVEADGRLVTCEETYADIGRGIYEFTAWPDVRIGQGDMGALVWFPDLGLRRLTFEALRATGTLRNIRARRAGNDFAITVVDYDRHLTTVTFATLAELRAMPAVTVTIPAIDRPLYFGWFTFTTPESPLPGNCDLRVPALTLKTLDGTPVAQYVTGTKPDGSADEGNIDALEQNAAASKAKTGLPSIGYWIRQQHGGRVPNVDLVGVEGYCNVGEAPAALETRLRAVIARCPRVVLIAQAYTSNASLTRDLSALVPIYARLARDCSNVVGLLGFSGSGRATGLQDHPDVRPLWKSLAAGIPHAPDAGALEPHTEPPAPHITILNYFPSEGKAPLRVKAIRGLSGGQAARILWRARKKGAASWVIVANNPATDPDHHYLFKTPGTYEIGCDVTAPDRPTVVVDGTSKARVVKVA